MDKNTTPIKGGLHTDNSRIDTPKGTYQYALNAVNETEQGDNFFVSNEGSNTPCGPLPTGFIPIASLYIGNNKTAIFSVSPDSSTSEIGIIDEECNYVTHVNGDLGFKVTHQIDATFRLRRGCETTVYWVDGKNNKPMYYVFEKPWQFQTPTGDWDKNKFELQRSYEFVPRFLDVEVLNSGGQLEPGSYNIAVRYKDENLNPTEWITTSEVIMIYNDDTDESFLDIRGSINIESGTDIEDYRDFATTDKAIRVVMDNLDPTFLFYQLAFIEASTGNGQISAIKYCQDIAIDNTIFIFTGTNFEQEGTAEEIKAVTNIIETAGSIEQADNMLLLGNTQGKQINYCKLQKYASKIQADMTVKNVLSNDMVDTANPKSPTARFEGVGYMAGEIYSFGVVYVFKDGSQSPVYHIPGKSDNILAPGGANVSADYIFQAGTSGQEVFPMSTSNKSLNSRYNDNSTCGTEDFWGVDSVGDGLEGQLVRHHRFPLRSEIGLPLVSLETTVGGASTYYQVRLHVTGTITSAFLCDAAAQTAGSCDVSEDGSYIPLGLFQVRVLFTHEGIPDEMVINIDPINYLGDGATTAIDLTEFSNYLTTDNIVITGIEETVYGNPIPVNIGVASGTGNAEHGSLTYVADFTPAIFNSQSRVYSTKMYGIQFSNVQLPAPEDIGGEEIIGYYIVRNERTEEEKTILDSAVLTPMVTNDKYISHGLLFPEFATDSRVSPEVLGLIHPEHKFYDRKYLEYNEVIQQGGFKVINREKSKARYLDITDGTSFDSSVHKSGGGKDDDGWSLKAITRDNITEFVPQYDFYNFDEADIEDTFYLKALQSRNIQAEEKKVFNIAGDNRIGIIELAAETPDHIITDTLPYVYLKRPIADSYSTFRSLPYYKTSINMHEFYDGAGNYDPASATAVEFAGDTYISAMRYLNTMWWDNRLAKRAGRTSILTYILGAVLVLIGALLTIIGVGVVVIGLGIAIIGAGALFVSSGIERDALVRAYYDEYDKGLRETTLDDWVDWEYVQLPCYGYGRTTCDTPEDDEIQWLTDCVTDLWFESQVNISLRYGMTSGVPTFLDAPGKVESGNYQVEPAYEHFDIYKIQDKSLYPFTALDKHVMDKLLVFSPERDDAREYVGHPLGEWYKVNPDFARENHEKSFFHLPLEYDCCSECQEDFPHRIHNSQQSFQEELTDNFRVFLPNDYRDIEGETGEITDLFRISNNIYVHTEEALWHQPQNFQERVTGDIVSFLGTGGYFSVPPRKILDDNKASAGTKHRWATTKSKHGVFFISENEGKIYNFNGNDLKALSDKGMSSWFNRNTKIKLLSDFYDSDGTEFPYDNNPSNPHGVGFVSVYDTEKERVIFTKKDKVLNENLPTNGDYEVCTLGGDLLLFEDFSQIIATRAAAGWIYQGMEDCRMKFEKTTYVPTTVTGQILSTVAIPINASIVIHYDTSGSFTTVEREEIRTMIDAWLVSFKLANPDWEGELYHFETGSNSGEYWINALDEVLNNPTLPFLATPNNEIDMVMVSFTNEAKPNYHGAFLNNPMDAPETIFNTHCDTFRAQYATLNSFKGLLYPVVFKDTGGVNDDNTRVFYQHALGALKGIPWTAGQVGAIDVNPGFTAGDWATLVASLQNTNPYQDDGLENYNWKIIYDTWWGGDPLIDIVDETEFNTNIEEFLQDTTPTAQYADQNIEILVASVAIEYEDGVPADLTQGDNSWTMSYSLKGESWTSWHSYLPEFYYSTAGKFYSWQDPASFAFPRPNSFYKHNVHGDYQTFFYSRAPFIIEYTSLSDPIKTRIWEDILIHTEAKKWDATTEEYIDQRFVTFNKAIIYNQRQCTGELTLEPKNTNDDNADYLLEQVVNNPGLTITVDKNEEDWSINDIRDIRVDYEKSIFDADIMSRQTDYYTDKILNTSALDENKSIWELESLRGKYLVVRLIFDNFDDVKLIMNYSVENETDSLT